MSESITDHEIRYFDFNACHPTGNGGDPRDFPMRSQLHGCNWERGELRTAFTPRAGVWPALMAPDVDNALVDANQWLLIKKNGELHFAVYHWVRPLQESKELTADELLRKGGGAGIMYPGQNSGVLTGWVPSHGDVIGVFLTTPARGSFTQNRPLFQARTNVKFLKFDLDGMRADPVGEEPYHAEEKPPVVEPPGEPPIHPGTGTDEATMQEIRDLKTAVEQLTAQQGTLVAAVVAAVEALKSGQASDISEATAKRLADVLIKTNEKLERGFQAKSGTLPIVGQVTFDISLKG